MKPEETAAASPTARGGLVPSRTVRIPLRRDGSIVGGREPRWLRHLATAPAADFLTTPGRSGAMRPVKERINPHCGISRDLLLLDELRKTPAHRIAEVLQPAIRYFVVERLSRR